MLDFPTLPVSMARLAQEMTLSVPVVCWVMPIAYTMAARLAPAYIRAAATTSSAGMPVISSTRSGVYSATAALSSSMPSVRVPTNSSSSKASLRMTCIMPLSQATSVPGRWRRWRVANSASWISRGSKMMSLAPFSTARMMRVDTRG